MNVYDWKKLDEWIDILDKNFERTRRSVESLKEFVEKLKRTDKQEEIKDE